jgi:hypothetical protein
MRWWWCHLGGTGLDDGRSGSTASDEHPSYLPRQLRFNDVLAGYGDVQDV